MNCTRIGRILLPATALALMPLTALAQEGTPPTSGSSGSAMPSLLDLAIQGGWFMIPIAIASIVTIAFTLERLAGLRTNRMLPMNLISELRKLVKDSAVDPRKAWDICQQHPSPLANSVKAAILKIGRPHAEVEKAVEDAVERETTGMTRNLRPINVVASIAPLLGLLGTVQGMIIAFMVTSTTTSTGTAKAQELAHGIYTALVTTFAGLCVAVVSVVLANWLEGRIERLLEKMEAIFLDLLPQFERFEGRMRVTESMDGEESVIRVSSTRRGSSNGSGTTATPPEGTPKPRQTPAPAKSGRAGHLSIPRVKESLSSDIRE